MSTDTERLFEMYERQIPTTEAVVANISKDQLELPTPCAEWNVEHVLDHLIGGCMTMAAAARGEKSSAIEESGNIGEDHVTAFREAARSTVESYRAADPDAPFEFPWGQTPPDVALNLALTDMTVHGWDLAKATDQDFEPDENIAEALYGFVTNMMVPKGQMPRGGNFGEPIDVPDDASAKDRLVAYLGRQP